jgi:spore coat protein U domain-containing protein, fimbrial subunit CupE1/2/3/6
MKNALYTFLLAASAFMPCAGSAYSATATDDFTVSITIVATCAITATNPLNFGNSVGLLSSNIDVNTIFSVQCTNGTPYDIELNAGNNAGTALDTTTRRMENGGEYVSYNLYQNAGRTIQWGTVLEGNEVTGATGDGNAQSYTVYGRVPAQATPAPGFYDDVIQIDVQY